MSTMPESIARPISRDEVDRAYHGEEIGGESKIARVALMICGGGVLFALLTGLLVHPQLGLWLCLIPVGYGAYYATVIAVLRRGWYRPWLRYLSSTLEVSAATLIALIDSVFVSPQYALTSAPQSIYFLAIVATTLRLDRWLSVYAGALAALQSALLYALLAPGLEPAVVTALPSVGPAVFLQRSGYLLFAGLLAAATSRTARRLARTVAAELDKRRQLRWLFGRYVPEGVVERILAGKLSTRGELRDVTVLCTDLRGFTAFSTLTSPPKVLQFLNDLFEKQCEIVARHGGRVDKFLGDGMLAIFGDPLTLDDHALCATRAAEEIAQLDAAALPGGPEEVRLCVGVHSGPVVVGNVGSADRFEYTTIGDTVNIAFRIENLNRDLGTRVLLSDVTARYLGAAADVEACAPARVRGRSEPLTTFALKGLA